MKGCFEYKQYTLKIMDGMIFYSATYSCLSLYLVVLVSCDSGKLSPWEDERVEVVPVEVFGIP